jgi:cytochrome c-type biogenesis protein CcmH/NrfG
MATPADREAVMETVKSSVNEYTTDEAEQRYLQGMLLENKHFFADAFYAYQDAVRLSPNNQQYTDELQSFITKYNMPLR